MNKKMIVGLMIVLMSFNAIAINPIIIPIIVHQQLTHLRQKNDTVKPEDSDPAPDPKGEWNDKRGT